MAPADDAAMAAQILGLRDRSLAKASPAPKAGARRARVQRAVEGALDIRASVRGGFPGAALEHLREELGVDAQTFFRVVAIAERTARRRIDDNKPLTAAESDRVYRVARIFARAIDVFEDRDKARRWLVRPCAALGDEVPLLLLDTDPGVRQVEDELGRIEYGVYA